MLRRFLHGFFAFAVLLASLGAEPHAVAVPAHHDCCCGDESQCPCEPVQPPQSPRGPGAPAAAPVQAALPAAPRGVAQVKRQAEPRPWQGWVGAAALLAGAADPAAVQPPRDLPRPPDRSLQKLAALSQFRI